MLTAPGSHQTLPPPQTSFNLLPGPSATSMPAFSVGRAEGLLKTPELTRPEYAYALVLFKNEKVVITGYQAVGIGRKGSGKDEIVIWIPAGSFIQCAGFNKFKIARQETRYLRYSGSGQAKFGREDILQLIKNEGRCKNLA